MTQQPSKISFRRKLGLFCLFFPLPCLVWGSYWVFIHQPYVNVMESQRYIPGIWIWPFVAFHYLILPQILLPTALCLKIGSRLRREPERKPATWVVILVLVLYCFCILAGIIDLRSDPPGVELYI